MVLQRNTKSSLYGYSSTPNATISVEFNTEVYNDSASRLASTGGGYFWKVYLNEMPGGFTAYTIKVTSSAGESATLDNILFGDVYLCSGQSNMQFAMDGMFDRVKEIENAEWYPNIRVFSLGQADLPQTTDPLDELVSVSQPWSVGSSDSVNSFDVWGYFSAVRLNDCVEIIFYCRIMTKHLFQFILCASIYESNVSLNSYCSKVYSSSHHLIFVVFIVLYWFVFC